MVLFISALDAESKEEYLLCASGDGLFGSQFSIEIYDLRRIPGAPFAYWLSDQIRDLFSEASPFESDLRRARIGGSTKNNFRFLRSYWEISPTATEGNGKWRVFAKGGSSQRYYADIDLVANWGDDAAEIEAELLGKYPYLGSNADFVLHRENAYGTPGITWTLRAARFSPQVLPAQSIFSDRGYAAHVPPEDLFATLSVFSSAPFDYLFKTFLGRHGHPEFLVGVLQRMPWIEPNEALHHALSACGRQGWSLCRSLDTAVEESHAFVAPALLQVSNRTFDECVEAWSKRVAAGEGELERVQAKVDELCFELYQISPEDRRAIVEGFGIGSDADEVLDLGSADEAPDDDDQVVEVDARGLAAGLVSWTVGVAVGRFDLRLATGERSWPAEPDPFDPLPVCAPGMLTGNDRLPVVESPSSYPVEVAAALVDDPGHRLDITARARSVFEVVFGDNADAWWTDVDKVLGTKGHDVSSWLHRGFFDHHLKTYSKSRRKAPIMWPIGTRSGSYVIWLYAHNVSADSLFQVLNDLLVPKLLVEENGLTQLRQEAGTSPTAAQRKAIDTQERFLGELREFRQLLEAVAPLWAPDLDDGIVLVLAPLWRLFAHHREWSSELRKQWVKLAKGDHDWAQIAMRLWPKRVVPKCGQDRSIAIAHGVEEMFWVRDPDSEDGWRRRRVPATLVDELVAQHRNPAVSAALERMGDQ